MPIVIVISLNKTTFTQHTKQLATKVLNTSLP